jgi:hypothetical protein
MQPTYPGRSCRQVCRYTLASTEKLLSVMQVDPDALKDGEVLVRGGSAAAHPRNAPCPPPYTVGIYGPQCALL